MKWIHLHMIEMFNLASNIAAVVAGVEQHRLEGQRVGVLTW